MLNNVEIDIHVIGSIAKREAAFAGHICRGSRGEEIWETTRKLGNC